MDLIRALIKAVAYPLGWLMAKFIQAYINLIWDEGCW